MLICRRVAIILNETQFTLCCCPFPSRFITYLLGQPQELTDYNNDFSTSGVIFSEMVGYSVQKNVCVPFSCVKFKLSMHKLYLSAT